MKKARIEGYDVYFNDKIYKNIAKDIINKKYEVLTEYKNTRRNYVARIKIGEKEYVLKSPRREAIMIQKKILSIFKKGEAITSFQNMIKAKNNGFDYFMIPYIVIVRKKIFIKESFILMDYSENLGIKTSEDIDKIIEMIRKLHANGVYHGDLNTSNFLKTKDGIKIIDTQCKREKLWWFNRSYDYFTLKEDLLVINLNYDVDKKYKIKKSLSYFLAFYIKKLKKVSLIQKIRKIKAKLRNKEWKI